MICSSLRCCWRPVYRWEINSWKQPRKSKNGNDLTCPSSPGTISLSHLAKEAFVPSLNAWEDSFSQVTMAYVSWNYTSLCCSYLAFLQCHDKSCSDWKLCFHWMLGHQWSVCSQACSIIWSCCIIHCVFPISVTVVKPRSSQCDSAQSNS